MSRRLRALGLSVLGFAVIVSALALGLDGRPGDEKSLHASPSQKPGKKKTRGKKAATKPADEGEDAATPTPAKAADAGGLKFSRDIAPIFVQNCVGCHNAKQKRGKLDISTFEALMKGTPAEKVIEGGKPGESHLVLRVKGEETPKMPQQANRSLSDAAIAKIEQWVKAGAVLDAGIDPKALLDSYAASDDEIRKNELAKLPADKRDEQVKTAGLARWKKVNPKVTPNVTSGAHFLLFSTLPNNRASAALKSVEAQYGPAKALLGASAVDSGEKVSLFVFADATPFIEFVRVYDAREADTADRGTARLNVAQPYVAVVDPLGGRDEPAGGGSARKGRGRRDDGGGVERTLNGLLAESYVIGATSKAGKTPRWLTLGLGAWFATKAEPKGGYGPALRHQAAEICQLGWATKASEALGDTSKTEDMRAVGFAVVEWLSTVAKSDLPEFVKEMRAGGDKLDDAIGNVLNGNREMFLGGSADFIMQKYGQP